MKATALLGAGLVALGAAQLAQAERHVVLNGQRLTDYEILQLERAHCGPIANGGYWLNFATGIWGYAGDPRPLGHISDNCYRPGRRPSLSERGLLFSPGDWTR